MFVKYGYNSYMNLSNVQAMELIEKKQNLSENLWRIMFLCNHSFSKNAGRGNEQRALFPIESASFPSKEDAEKWLKIFVEAYYTGKLEKQPDYWD